MTPMYYNYQFTNVVNNMSSPSSYRCKDSGIVGFFRKYLLQKAFSVFEWGGIPDNWDFSYLLYALYTYGFVCVLKTRRFGIVPQMCSLTGYDIYYRPTNVIVSNPVFTTEQTAKIGYNTELIKLQPNYSGIMDIVNYYADLLGLVTESLAVNLINTKTTPVFEAASKAEAETLKKMYDKIASGEPCVVTNGNVTKLADNGGFNFFYPATGGMYISDKLLQNYTYINNMYDTDIGIPNANIVKKERLLTDEINSNNFDTLSKASVWFDELTRCLSKVNDMFGLNITIKWKELKNDGATNNSNGVGTLPME